MKGSFSHARSDSTWRQQRKILNHSLKEQNLSAYHNIFVKTSKRMVDKIQYETGVFDVGIQAKMASLDSIFGTHLGCETNMMENKITRYTVKWGGIPISKTLINPFFGFFFNILIPIFPILRPTEKIIKECVKDAMKDNQQTDIDDHIEKRYLKAVLQQYVSVDESFNEIKKELMETLIVGSHSVGLSVGTTLVFLASLPEIQEKVWQEQQDIFGDSDRDPTITDVKRMEYLERVVKEVYRFISPPYMARKTRADINIDGTIIPTNTTVIVCSYLMRTDNQFWENPLKFDPDRYLRKEPMVDYKYSFSNFGYGIRNCPGYHYANNQVKVMLSTILRRFQVVTTGRRFEDIKLTARILMEIPEGYYISIKKRETLKK